ncbi:CocE/NonD family hydrolase [Singulisphaera acidiphila]|uniref:Putative hydrolase, CocE/NonD family n=1 Tax=Singulisphaera acidiphila (strain ATCC BAA-1392 / DSM 18658 / VKM B-2454 / MOB10) TaxID=886293 RepID=L0DBY5_SINAD|nr:CocE/NonD family hydrolase [Singulisphaera acidiphila]AGA26757.1 putative hydrolase, CocE/NonD family [Singulisphaera acidiphila DSM 18658]
MLKPACRFAIILALTIGGVEAAEPPPETDLGTVTETHVMVPMRDGVRLSTYIYTSKGDGPWPVLYEQRYADLRGGRKNFARMAAAGYVVVGQNFRGSQLSEGTWVGYRDLGWGEKRDGYDTVEWLAKQPWSTGKVGTFGSSQAGFAQNFLAVTRPPHLKCQYMIDTGLSLFHEGYRIGGATRPERFKTMDAVCRNPEDNRRLLKEWFTHPTYDAYWAEEDCTRHLDAMNVPCFTVGSWFDFMCVGSVESFIGRQHRGGPKSRGTQQLLIGPWLHGGSKSANKVGELTFPEDAQFAMDTHMIRWFDHYLKGVDNGVEREPAVRYYAMGAVGEEGAPGNEWRTASDWPLSTQDESLYLQAGGKLTAKAPETPTSSTTFLADPLHPNEIPARGFPGAKDAREFEKQEQVRTFTTDPLPEPVEWTGKVKAELYVSSSARDTDFIVRVSDVYPDGRSVLLMDYVRRARYRDGYDREVFLEPGKVAKVAFDVGWTSQVFNRGHRIRITVASTGAPFYEPNPNTGEPLTLDFPLNAVVATNIVYHERPHASRIIAPVRPIQAVVDKRQEIEQGLKEVSERLENVRSLKLGKQDQLADAEVFAKGITWALRYESNLPPADLALLKKALERCHDRLRAIEDGKPFWLEKKGPVVRGFISAVDGSVQPYGVIVPAKYDRAKPIRLDVVLHGSSLPTGMSELRFMKRFDEADSLSTNAPDQDFLELHPLGRVENGYRWAGETDVFEAIEAACRNYAIDRDRIVIRGMSMGASGTWHLGLKHPDRFVALGPYCGYVDTRQFSLTPVPRFVKVGELPSYQDKGLHMLDSVDYAANAGIVPAIACMGEKDENFQAHEMMGRAMAKEGLTMVNLISPGTGHVIDPVTHREQMRRIHEFTDKGLNHVPNSLRFVTWTLKYSRCHWMQILGMAEHYARAELEAKVLDDGMIEVAKPTNVTRFAILPPVAKANMTRIRVGSELVPITRNQADRAIVIAKQDGRWVDGGDLDDSQLTGKRPGLQGPIDDAFTTPFLCVRGTGTPWNSAVQAWSDASLKQFATEWNRYFRGELPIKDDTAVTPDDLRRANLILFGDPGSNLWISKVLPQLPIRWTQDECTVGNATYTAADHAPLLIHPNPLAPNRYVVLNSGHTFHEQELSTLNYLLFPRLGDWAVVKLAEKTPGLGNNEIIQAGLFDEHWRLSGGTAN